MGLQLKGDQNNTSSDVAGEQRNPWDAPKKEDNPWDAPARQNVALDIEEPKVIYNTAMAEAQAKQNGSSEVVGIIIKFIILFAVSGLLFFAGEKIVSKVMPEGQDITTMLGQKEDALSTSLGETFVDNPVWAANVYHYSKGTVTVKGAEDIGVVYIDGRQVGVHITSKEYTIFDVQIGDGEKNMYDNTTYPFDSFISIMDTINGGRSTLYIYYSNSRNDCIFFRINNTTNRIESMTYYSDYKKVTETLDTF